MYLWNCIDRQNTYSKMNMRQLHISFNSAKTWHVIVCWFLCFPLNLPELNLKLFCSDVQNNFKFSSGKFGENRRNQHTITCQVLAELNEIWSCLIFIKLKRQWHKGSIFFTQKKGRREFFFFLTRPSLNVIHENSIFGAKKILTRSLNRL